MENKIQIAERIEENWIKDNPVKNKDKAQVLRLYIAKSKRFRQERIKEYRQEEHDLRIL